jgi:uncharacterized protein YehS (DUF1456 family)
MFENKENIISVLKHVNFQLNRNEIILWLNENDVDYFNWNDIEMIIGSSSFSVEKRKRANFAKCN